MRTVEEPMFTPGQKTLFGMLARSLFDQNFFPGEDTDWEEVFNEAYAHTVLTAAFSNLRDCRIPTESLNRIKGAIRPLMMRDTVIHNAHTVIHTLLTDNGIPYVIFKGAASAYYYPRFFLRDMGDVDFFVPDAYREQALALLGENGFEEIHGNERLHTVLKWRGVKFELHHDLPGVPEGAVGDRVRCLCENITDNGIRTTTDSATFVRPTDLHHCLILLLHTQQHLTCEGLGLRHICDWAAFVHAMGDRFTAVLKEPLECVGLWRFACFLSLVSVKAVGLPEKPWMTADGDPSDFNTADLLLKDIMDGGNFGCKDRDRSRVYESLLMDPSSPRDGDRTDLERGFAAVNRWVRERWPAARKCPLLLPFGWIYFLLRRVFLVVTGRRRRVHVCKTMENTRKRQNLYRQLNLFRPQDD